MKEINNKPKTAAEFFESVDSSASIRPEFKASLEEKLLHDYINYEAENNMGKSTETEANLLKRFGIPLAALAAIGITTIALGALYFSGVVEQATTPQYLSGEVAYKEGKAEYRQGDQGWKEVSEETEIKPEMDLRIIGEGKLIINLDDGSAIRIGDDSEINLTSLDPEDLKIENRSGKVYTRVAKAERNFTTKIADANVRSNDSAYSSKNDPSEKYVQVFNAKVEIEKDSDTKIEVPAGKKYFIDSEDEDKVGTTIAISKTDVEKDEFLKWNREQDREKLGDSADLGLIDPDAFGEINLKGQVGGDYIRVYWDKIGGIDSSSINYKTLKSSSETPTLSNSKIIGETTANSDDVKFEVRDGKQYNFRVCAYSAGRCILYSNIQRLTASEPAPKPQPAPAPKPQPAPAPAPSTGISITGIEGTAKAFKVFWSNPSNANQGYKIAYSRTNQNPSYGSDASIYVSDGGKTHAVASKLDPGTYYVRVCRYTGSGCDSYSQMRSVVVQDK